MIAIPEQPAEQTAAYDNLEDWLLTTLRKSLLPRSSADLAKCAVDKGLLPAHNFGRSNSMIIVKTLSGAVGRGQVAKNLSPDGRCQEYAWQGEAVKSEDKRRAETIAEVVERHTKCGDTPTPSDRCEPHYADVPELIERDAWAADERAVLEALNDPFLTERIAPPRHPRADLYAEVCYRLADKPQLHTDIRQALHEIGDYFSQPYRQTSPMEAV